MAKSADKYMISFDGLKSKLSKEKIPNNILFSINGKILFDEILEILCFNFAGKDFNPKNNLITFSSEDKLIESVINECSNTGLFSDKKIVVLKNIRKLLKNDKLALLDYLKRSNPDTCLVMESSGEELNPAKIFFYDKKESNENSAEYKNIIESNVEVFEVNELNQSELIKWVKEKFGDYKISEDTITYFLQFSNYAPDELLTEIEKLKTYCYNEKEITSEAVNLCNGMTKEFNEGDFIKALIEKDREKAYGIYESISLKKDVEILLVFLINSSFIAISKMFDPSVDSMNEWDLKRTLKLWFPDQIKLLPLYKKFRDSSDFKKISGIIGLIYKSDKMLKSSGTDRKNVMANLINNICAK